jgi:uncharacterized membrane protein YbjE (DUF340 family)
MKRLLKFLDFLYENDILTALAYIITLGWFAYAANIVISSDGNVLGKIFFFAWSIVLAFIWLIHKSSNDLDQH